MNQKGNKQTKMKETGGLDCVFGAPWPMARLTSSPSFAPHSKSPETPEAWLLLQQLDPAYGRRRPGSPRGAWHAFPPGSPPHSTSSPVRRLFFYCCIHPLHHRSVGMNGRRAHRLRRAVSLGQVADVDEATSTPSEWPSPQEIFAAGVAPRRILGSGSFNAGASLPSCLLNCGNSAPISPRAAGGV